VNIHINDLRFSIVIASAIRWWRHFKWV